MHAVINAALPVFGLILLGYLAGRSARFEGSATDTLNRFAFYFALPALIFLSLARLAPGQLPQLGFFAAFGGAVAATWALGYVVSRWQGRDHTDALIEGCNAGYSNVGFMGVPLCFLLFGAQGIVPAAMSVLMTACVQFLLAIVLVELALKGRSNLKLAMGNVLGSLLRNPLFLAPLTGIAISISCATLPVPAEKFAELLGNAAAPVALFCIGLALFDTNFDGRDMRAIVTVTTIKLLIQPFIAAILAFKVFSMPALWAQAAVLLSALPIGSGIFTIAKTYGRDTGVSSGAIFASHVASLVTLSILIASMV